MSEYILEMRNITKEFSGVKALDNVNLAIKKGEIHALCGENGAGKSTLMKVLSGVYPYKTYTGDIIINGEKKRFRTVGDSEKAGVAIIYQELALVKDITVAENIFLGKLANKAGIVNWHKTYADAKKILDEMGVGIDLNQRIKDIGVGQQQLVEIAKALVLNADILILDEPTAALTETEVELLMKILRGLKAKGVTCILITHKLNEIFEIADSVTVLRDGQTIETSDIKEINENELVRRMVGRELTQRYPQAERVPKEVMLKVEDFSYNDPGGKGLVEHVSFYARAGEIVGIAGLMGAGRTELVTGLFGFFKGKTSGKILVDGEEKQIKSPKDAINAGMAMVSEDRKQYGLILKQSIRSNISISSLKQISSCSILNENKEFSEAKKYAEILGVKAHSIEMSVGALSGGNQQKVLLARCLMTKPKVLFLDEPTRGIDVGAKYEIYVLMNQLAAQGTAIVMVSSELPEVLGMSDRVLVMHEGRLVGEIDRAEATQEKIMMKASGGK